MKNANSNNGFSLLELSITITIISLLIVATLTGQSMKHRLELSQIMADMSNITSGVKQFKSLYGNYVPGDLYNASDSFPGAINGDGSGFLETSNASSKNEELIFWQHLVLSGLISNSVSGSYDGTTVTGDGGVMKAQLSYGLYSAHKALNVPSASVNPTGRLLIQVSKSGNVGILSTKDAADIDTKFDNGNPIGTAGLITSADGAGETAGNCVTAGGVYNLANTTGTPCVIYIYLE